MAVPAADFPVVGIGCSAGGLAAVEKFLAHVPVDSGMAFVVVQHLDPSHDSILAELLRHVTPMAVAEVGDGMAVEPDHVYVIPPNKDLSIHDGRLRLLDPVERRGPRHPIDSFLRALAEDRREKAIGIVLSGMGDDGALGLDAIKEMAGLVVVQDPASAQEGGMPGAAIAAGLADIVALPEKMPALIAGYLDHLAQVEGGAPSDDGAARRNLDKIVAALQSRCGSDFSLYKTNTLARRVERRIALNQVGSLAKYVRHVRDNPEELDLLFKELLIGVTEFFRDAEVWEYLRATALPALLARYPEGKSLRAWVPGCSTGEEAYSLAMTFAEVAEKAGAAGRFKLQIYATDLDPDAIRKARKGCYSGNIAVGVSAERLARHFTGEADGYRIGKAIREMVVFAPQNVISDPPFTTLDILSCRNLLIYFRPELQAKVLALFGYALNPGGLLLLGRSETVADCANLFVPVDAKAHLFRRLDLSAALSELLLPGKPKRKPAPIESEAVRSGHADNIGHLTDQLIQLNYAPAAVLINGDGDLLHVSGHTGKYLEPAAGKVSMNVYAMAREGLRGALPGAVQRALRSPGAMIDVKGLRVDGGRSVEITVQAIEKPEALRGRLLIVFHDVATPGKKGRKLAASAGRDALRQDVEQAQDALQAMREKMRTSLDDLTSSNEELQSTNEELMTSKEEMQSLNEELQTVLAERQSKVESLGSMRNDMENLLNSTEIATIFLDVEMRIRRFTAYATKLFRLIPADVGRPLSDVARDLDYPALMADVQDVLRTRLPRERRAGTGDGCWYRVRIMLCRTQDHVIDGVVITFTDISEIRALEERLRKRPNGSE